MLYQSYYAQAYRDIATRSLELFKHILEDKNTIMSMRKHMQDLPSYWDRKAYVKKLKGKWVFHERHGLLKVTTPSGDDFYARQFLINETKVCSAFDHDVWAFSSVHQAKRIRKWLLAQIRAQAHLTMWKETKSESARRDQADNIMRKIEFNKTKRKVGYQIAESLAYAIKHSEVDDYDILTNQLNSPFISTEVRTNLFDAFTDADTTLRDSYFICDDCGYIYNTDEQRDTYNEHIVCDTCANENYNYSEYHDTYIPSNDARPLYLSYRAYNRGDPDDYLSRSCDYDYYYEDGAYFDSETYDEIYNNDEGDEDFDGLHDYHGAHRDFKEQWTDKRYVPLGVEVEVYSSSRYDTVQSLRNNFPELYLERDGSLDDDHGFEIITQPYGKSEWNEFAPRLLQHLLRHGVLGYNHPDDNSYGIHISINREYLSPLQEARMSLFLTASENEGFVKAIAQRNAIYGGSSSIQMGNWTKMGQTIRNVGGLTSHRGKTKIAGMGKYSPLNLKYEIAECRIFQSTLHPQSFMKNLEFIWALVEWTSVKAATGSSWLHTDFVKWLAKRPNADTDFGNLVAYLRRPKYIVKRGSGSITNTWLSELPHITTKSQPTEDIEEEALAA